MEAIRPVEWPPLYLLSGYRAASGQWHLIFPETFLHPSEYRSNTIFRSSSTLSGFGLNLQTFPVWLHPKLTVFTSNNLNRIPSNHISNVLTALVSFPFKCRPLSKSGEDPRLWSSPGEPEQTNRKAQIQASTQEIHNKTLSFTSNYVLQEKNNDNNRETSQVASVEFWVVLITFFLCPHHKPQTVDYNRDRCCSLMIFSLASGTLLSDSVTQSVAGCSWLFLHGLCAAEQQRTSLRESHLNLCLFSRQNHNPPPTSAKHWGLLGMLTWLWELKAGFVRGFGKQQHQVNILHISTCTSCWLKVIHWWLFFWASETF